MLPGQKLEHALDEGLAARAGSRTRDTPAARLCSATRGTMPPSSRGRSVEANATPARDLGVVSASLADRVADEVEAVPVQPRERERSFNLAESSRAARAAPTRARRLSAPAKRHASKSQTKLRSGAASSCRCGPSARAKRAKVTASTSAPTTPPNCARSPCAGSAAHATRSADLVVTVGPRAACQPETAVACALGLGLTPKHAPENAHQHARPCHCQLEAELAEPLRLRRK